MTEEVVVKVEAAKVEVEKAEVEKAEVESVVGPEAGESCVKLR
jgi:hypothetical protein